MKKFSHARLKHHHNAHEWRDLTDSHCHVDHLNAAQWREVYDRARDAGVRQFVCVATNEASYRRTRHLCEGDEGIFCSLGLHPHESKTFVESDWRALFEAERVDAVGECGLDYHYMHSAADRQKKVFGWHLEMAEQSGLPVIVHIRDAYADALSIMRPYAARGVRGVVHCFSGATPDMRAIVDLGWYVGFAGIVTFGASAAPVREALQACPIERVLIETDSPYLAPASRRGTPNEPAYLAEIAHACATLKQVSYQNLADQTTRNARAFLGLDEGA